MIVGVMASAKLVPLLLLAWLIGQRRWSAVAAFGAAVVACAALVHVGAGSTSISDYLAIAAHIQPSGKSLAGLTGIAQASLVTLGAMALLSILLPRRPALAFAVACTGMVIGSPEVNVNWLVMLLPAVAALASWSSVEHGPALPMSGAMRRVSASSSPVVQP